MQAESQAIVDKLLPFLQRPFWSDPAFWITQAIGVAGLVFAILAWVEAQKAKIEAEEAKRAAKEAGRTVRIQTSRLNCQRLLRSWSDWSQKSGSMRLAIYCQK